MKVGLFSPYLDTAGGGEKYLLTAAETFLQKGFQVDIFWDGQRDINAIKERFGLNLEGANFTKDIFSSKTPFLEKLLKTSSYDLVFFLSDGSIPTTLAKSNILHFQVPFKFDNGKNILNKIKLSRFSHVVCNSNFTKNHIDKTFGINSEVLYPPIDVENFKPGKKENIILGVGRFFAPLHPKKQEIMTEAFKKMKLDWELVLIGGVTGEDSKKSVEDLKKASAGYKIKIIPDSSLEVLKDYYARAKLFWHVAGFGEDLETYPQRAEHFGMVTAEAMAAGCVPVVFNGGGQPEIVDSGKNGYLWQTVDELEEKTNKLIKDKDLLSKLSKAAISRVKDFNKERFSKGLMKMLIGYV